MDEDRQLVDPVATSSAVIVHLVAPALKMPLNMGGVQTRESVRVVMCGHHIHDMFGDVDIFSHASEHCPLVLVNTTQSMRLANVGSMTSPAWSYPKRKLEYKKHAVSSCSKKSTTVCRARLSRSDTRRVLKKNPKVTGSAGRRRCRFGPGGSRAREIGSSRAHSGCNAHCVIVGTSIRSRS